MGINSVIHRPGFVYLCECQGIYKIGCSTQPDKRLKEMQTSRWDQALMLRPLGKDHRQIQMIHMIYTEDMRDLEQYLHGMFDGKKHGRSEWFDLTLEDVEMFKGLLG